MSAAAGTPLVRPDADTIQDALDLIHEEALCLDGQRWDDWLALFTVDARFWLPAWTDEHRLSRSPDSELSLMYCSARSGLEDRVWRVRSGLSVASTPLPRTTHQVSNSVVRTATDGSLVVRSSFACHVHRLRQRSQHLLTGHYEHRLVRVEGPADGGWRIAAKTIVLMNPVIPTMIDFYCV